MTSELGGITILSEHEAMTPSFSQLTCSLSLLSEVRSTNDGGLFLPPLMSIDRHLVSTS